MTPNPPLSPAELALKLACERAIHTGLTNFIAVGEALQTIRDRCLYRADYATFADYCQTMWAMSASRARQLCLAAQVVLDLASVTNGNTPTELPENERQARALLSFPAGHRATILGFAAAQARATETELSAALITHVGAVVMETLATGAVDLGDGESTVLSAAITQEVYETQARQSQHIRDKQNRVTVQGQVFTVTDDPNGYYRIAVRADQPGAEKLHNLQLVSVTFTPQTRENERENQADVKQEMRHG